MESKAEAADGDSNDKSAARKIAEAATKFQFETTGHNPRAVSVVLSDETLVITLLDALTPAEKALTSTAQGASKVQNFHRELFASSSESLRKEIERITGRKVREAVAEVDPSTGAIVHAFTSGTMVQVFLLASDPSEPATPS
jgi:uncharacterized protein YbcI